MEHVVLYSAENGGVKFKIDHAQAIFDLNKKNRTASPWVMKDPNYTLDTDGNIIKREAGGVS